MSQSLFLALAAEHKQRTGHDIFTQRLLSITPYQCDVCLHLGAEYRAYQEAESRHYQEMEAEHRAQELEPTP